MQTELFIKKTRALTSEINEAVEKNQPLSNLQEKIEEIASELRNPTLVCLKYLVESSKVAGLDASSIKSKFIRVDYSN